MDPKEIELLDYIQLVIVEKQRACAITNITIIYMWRNLNLEGGKAFLFLVLFSGLIERIDPDSQAWGWRGMFHLSRLLVQPHTISFQSRKFLMVAKKIKLKHCRTPTCLSRAL